MTETAPGRRGPKRSEQSRSAILAAAFEVTAEVGYRALTVEGIALRAGVGKQTVYRWWPSKADVLLEALAVRADVEVSVDDRGSYRVELEEFCRDSFALLSVPGVAAALRGLMAEAQLGPDFGTRFRSGFLQRRRAALAEVLRRAHERGDAPHVAPDELVTDLVFGAIWYRLLATDRPLSETDVSALCDLLGAAPAAP
ncbi:transcriptional regulator, TetR family [Quadrisphaera granulorum]|uniref:TetR family transcriptional regulator n=1 Tax=Quadrisphaera granulorum TaxID=317664 RepID=A0A315ZQB7_9ACTN|nr:TetR/AcrR family transcriptional regulator [Quadrisphaera granulorum]PWJ46854.1 TetR family transcriptional regulator [Quadrisphaera granulorum]SZE99021.1 transcriptional regulator, TetR family [Quadrisphaera granulorum]